MIFLAKSKPSPGLKAQVLKDKEEREAIVLWRQPVNTLYKEKASSYEVSDHRQGVGLI